MALISQSSVPCLQHTIMSTTQNGNKSYKSQLKRRRCDIQLSTASHKTSFIHNGPLSRRPDRCDRVIQNEFNDPNGSNVCLFLAATYTSQCKFRSMRANLSALIYTTAIGLRQRVASLALDCNGVFAIKAYIA